MRHRARAIAAAALAAIWVGCNGAAKDQPIAFNHDLHVAKGGMPCETCHEHASDRAHAGLPRIDVCMDCHKRVTPQNPAGAAQVDSMRKLAREGGELYWVRVYELAAHVYFSHQRHTEVAGLECKVCHGDMAKAKSPPAQPIAQTLQMDHCIACHESRGVTTDCAACHR
ncbi:MAG TPA: cytochrome c3 family protein [Myxococcales bacterium]